MESLIEQNLVSIKFAYIENLTVLHDLFKEKLITYHDILDLLTKIFNIFKIENLDFKNFEFEISNIFLDFLQLHTPLQKYKAYKSKTGKLYKTIEEAINDKKSKYDTLHELIKTDNNGVETLMFKHIFDEISYHDFSVKIDNLKKYDITLDELFNFFIDKLKNSCNSLNEFFMIFEDFNEFASKKSKIEEVYVIGYGTYMREV